MLNKEAGHLLRTKISNSDEGGVAAGFAVLDSPYLTWLYTKNFSQMICTSLEADWHIFKALR